MKAGSGASTLGTPDSAGVPSDFTHHTLSLPYNDLMKVEEAFRQYPRDIAAIILEPVAGNMGVVIPSKGFLQGLRKLCDRYQSLLIFDEVMTGFRFHYGGAQKLFKILPDMTCLGKIIGGGMPLGAFGGRAAVLWNPSIQTTNASFGVRTNQFGFTITGTANIPIVVEASASLASASWTPLQTCTLTNGSIYFNDPQWTNYPARFYRVRSP